MEHSVSKAKKNRYETLAVELHRAMLASERAWEECGRDRGRYRERLEAHTYEQLRRAFLDEHMWPLYRAFGGEELPAPEILDAALEMIAVDTPAPGLCHLKSWLLTKLKRVPLTAQQAELLRTRALLVCALRSYGHCRGEVLRLQRLMLRLADETFLRRLLPLRYHTSLYVAIKAQELWAAVLNGRPDIRDAAGRALAAAERQQMSEARYDDLDLRILQLLLADGRLAPAELARRLGCEEAEAARRVQSLVGRGVIRGYQAVIEPARLGLPITALIHLRLERKWNHQLPAEALARPEILEAYRTSGEYHFLRARRSSPSRCAASTTTGAPPSRRWPKSARTISRQARWWSGMWMC
jgi:DNA-binding Lrp family transcriptional regulator